MIAIQLLGHVSELITAGAPNPAPTPPPGTSAFTDQFLGWLKWIGLIAGVGGLMVCGLMMTVGRRNRHSMAVEGAAGIPWTIAGLAVIALSSGIVGTVLS